MREPSVPLGLKKMYAKLLGERDHISNPPKRSLRLASDRADYESGAEQRAQRLREIEEALPHLAFVIRMVDPLWLPGDTKPIRPKRLWSDLPNQGMTAAAVDVLRDATAPMTIEQIVFEVGQRYDLDLTTVAKRQKAHTAVNHGVKRSFGDRLVSHGGRPERFSVSDD